MTIRAPSLAASASPNTSRFAASRNDAIPSGTRYAQEFTLPASRCSAACTTSSTGISPASL